MSNHTESERATPISKLKQARLERLLATTERVFLETGCRAATMEAIAEAAGMSKVTLYGYLPDKEAAFLAVARRFAAKLLEEFTEALFSQGSTADRAAAALLAKHERVLKSVRSSTHALDLFATKDSLARAVFEDCDLRMEVLLADEFIATGTAVDQARQTAKVLFHSCLGIANASVSLESLRSDVTLLVTAMLRKS
jgi:AcrR family transcriptional regulator